VVDRRWQRGAFRTVFAAYLAGLLGWLGLGLLPTLAAGNSTFRGWIASVATRQDGLGHAAGRILHPSMAMIGTGEALQQYAFSALNLAPGLLLAARRPDEREPRLLALALLGTAATFNIPSHRAFHITGSPWPVALAHFTFHIVSGVTYLWAVVLFPSGSLPRQLRLGAGAMRVAVVVVTAAAAFICWRSSFLAHPQFFVIFFGIAVPVAGVVAQSLRLADRTTPAAERRVARLLCGALVPAAATGLVWATARLVVAVGGPGLNGARRLDELAQEAFPVLFALVPMVLFVGVVRYRLWDIDRLLSRVLVYGLLASVVAVVYVAAVATGGRLAGHGLWWTVAVLAAAASLLQPLHDAARRWANRVVFGQVLSPSEAMRTLITGLEQLTPTGELDQVPEVVVASTRATAAALWVAEGGRLVPVAGRAGTAAADVAAVSLGDPMAGARALGVRRCWPVAHQGNPLGLLAVDHPESDALSAADEELIGDVAAHTGLLLHNAMLTVRLGRHVAELDERSNWLRAARRRLVTAQDAERQRLERDLHDGAQQALVAAVIGLRATAALAASGAELQAELEDLDEVLGIAYESLVDLCGADRPAVLVEHGLRGALQRAAQLAGRGGPTVRVEVAEPAGGTISAAEVAVYFCCLEALQNATKHAHANLVSVEVACVAGEWRFAVTDDGVGFDVGAPDGRGGLAKLAERVGVFGGQVRAESAPGAGTRVRGTVPLAVASDLAVTR
jgi:signal transduction histidine kinase